MSELVDTIRETTRRLRRLGNAIAAFEAIEDGAAFHFARASAMTKVKAHADELGLDELHRLLGPVLEALEDKSAPPSDFAAEFGSRLAGELSSRGLCLERHEGSLAVDELIIDTDPHAGTAQIRLGPEKLSRLPLCPVTISRVLTEITQALTEGHGTSQEIGTWLAEELASHARRGEPDRGRLPLASLATRYSPKAPARLARARLGVALSLLELGDREHGPTRIRLITATYDQTKRRPGYIYVPDRGCPTGTRYAFLVEDR